MKVLGSTVADSEGKFALDVKSEDDGAEIALEIVGYLEGFAIRIEYPDEVDLANGINLILARPRNIRCRVLRENGAPVEGVNLRTVSARSTRNGDDNSYPFTSRPTGMTTWPSNEKSGPNGFLEIAGIESEAEIIVELDDQRFAKQRWKVPAGMTESEFVVSPARFIKGVVVSATDRQPIEATVAFTFWSDRKFIEKELIQTDRSGRFELKPPVCEEVSIRVHAADRTFEELKRRIPWPAGTIIQRMTLPVYRQGDALLDGTTADGQTVEKINRDAPQVTATCSEPTDDLPSDSLRGMLLLSGNVTIKGKNASESGLFTVDLESGEWRCLDVALVNPRISKDGEWLVGNSRDGELLVSNNRRGTTTRIVQDGFCTRAMFGGNPIVANFWKPSAKHYYGEEHWGLENETWFLDSQGRKLRQLELPSLFETYDVSNDGLLLALNQDTHCAETGAQIFVARTDGTDFKAVARKKFHYYWYPLFSPDGTTLLTKHLHATGGRCTTNILALDGSFEHEITIPEPFESEYHCWSPDGKFVAIVGVNGASGERESKVFIVNLAGTAVHKLSINRVERLSVDSIFWSTKQGLVNGLFNSR